MPLLLHLLRLKTGDAAYPVLVSPHTCLLAVVPGIGMGGFASSLETPIRGR